MAFAVSSGAALSKNTFLKNNRSALRLRSQAPRGVSSRVALSVRAGVKDDILLGLSGAATPSTEDRLLVNELLPKLEAANPSSEPAYSPLLEGDWEMVYTGGVSPGPVPSPTREIALLMYAGGFTPGMFLMSVFSKLPDEVVVLGKPSLSIKMDQPRVTAKVPLTALGRTEELVLRNSLDAESNFRLRETYTEAELMGNTVSLPDPLKWERLMFITYLDETTLVVRDETGSPDVLVRKSPAPVTPEPEVAAEEPTTESTTPVSETPVVEADFVEVDGDVTTTDYKM